MEVRCEKCNKLLFVVIKKGQSVIEVKCPRCKTMNVKEA